MLILQLICIAGFVYGIRLMSSPKTAVAGNLLGAGAMLGAVLLTLLGEGILTLPLLWAGLILGSAIGVWLALKVLMIQMPQMVALLNGLGGGASALVALVVIGQGGEMNVFTWFTTGLAIIVGGITLSGSLVAAGKLHGKLSQRPFHIHHHNLSLWLTTGLMLVSLALLSVGIGSPVLHGLLMAVVSLGFGILFTIRVGGADMPITISLLNSLSGVAGAIAGMSLHHTLLVVVGAVVGASGLILTQIMCRAMNRSLWQILLGKTTAAVKTTAPMALISEEKQHQWEESLQAAETVAIIPGYGMALAQAQQLVKELSDKLQAQGKEVKFGIHPVAGRMPGHMNVLLAEADVWYEHLYDLEQINDFLQTADLAIIVGANDVVNLAAIELEGTPIYGMPIIRADQAKQVLVCNYDTKPGYAGVDNSLYGMGHVHLLVGDAKDSLEKILNALEGEPAAGGEAGLQPAELLEAAQRVVIVPGYGMALAQAQMQVKRLIDILQSAGKEVQIAIHPVAGRMPGHMNVLLAEVDVPYELMYEMDQINDQFEQVDVVVVVGANDVVNPAAITHPGTPIYGMPILHVERARHVLVFNLDRSPGYAGVPNTLYDAPNCTLIEGDAASTLNALLQSLRAAA
ncbi:MAG: NAD(P)(+) transhydrogenase (Re/Si-specific) subunit beta [Firmicutes bacterium]|jgi:NAD/NADP transhydrogenase beta subunit|nr:NAD(P)(+) transhydrogenase (Re/Si-specific) subunit beta [Bacillota bacterium]NLO66547.1 NAD(P)(+) transhydrogenase (Re/Si-specific) subunit beta [Bacillota bacterium]